MVGRQYILSTNPSKISYTKVGSLNVEKEKPTEHYIPGTVFLCDLEKYGWPFDKYDKKDL